MIFYKITDGDLTLAENLTWDEATQFIDAIDDVSDSTAIIEEMNVMENKL